MTVPSTGDTVHVLWQFYGDGTAYGLGSIAFADGTTWDRGQILAATQAPIRPVPGSVVTDPSDVEIAFGSADGASVQGHGTSHGLTLDWASDSGSATAWFWSDANRAEGSDPSVLDLIGLNPSEVTLSRVSDPDWGGEINDLLVTNNVTGKTLTITREFSGYSGDGVGSIAFADGTALDHDQIAARAGCDQRAGSNDVTLNAPDGNASLTAGTGDDTFVGGNGNDTFIYTSQCGNLTIDDVRQPGWKANVSTLSLADISPGQVTFSRSNNDLLVAISGSGRTIDVANEFDLNAASGIDCLTFSSGSTLSRADIAQKIQHP